MRLTWLESAFVWLVALGCVGLAVGAIQLPSGRRFLAIAILLTVFAYTLATRSLGAVMLVVLVAVLATVFGVLMAANGSIPTGFSIALGGAVVTAVLGRAVLRELEWWV